MLDPKALRASIAASKEIEGQLVKEGRKGRPKWEYVLFLAVLVVSLLIVIWIRYYEIDHFRRMLLRTELWQMRNAIHMYYSIYKTMPESLVEFSKEYVVHLESGEAIPFVEGVEIDKYDRLVDPFGYPYIYDSKKGTIRSQAPCCRDW